MSNKYTKVRESNIELLRIIAMIMIVLSHYVLHSEIDTFNMPIGFNRFLLEVANLGDIGVIIFVLITGYFSIKSDNPFKMKKLVMLIFEVVFYSLVIYVIFLLLGIIPFSIKELIHNLFPITYQMYWFMSVFVLLYIFIPFINILLNSCDRKKHLNLIFISILIFSVIGTFTNRLNYANEFVQFIMFYIIGAYFGKYNEKIFTNKKNNYIVFIVVSLVMICSVILFDFINKDFSFGIDSSYLFRMTKISSILFSISLFHIFRNTKSFNSNLINVIASSTLGVYLIHENNLVINVLWSNFFHVNEYVSSSYLLLHMILSTIIVFVVCSFIDLVRHNTIERLFSTLYDKIEHRLK